MMGRAGRPQFDDEGKACVLVHEPKKVRLATVLHSTEAPVAEFLHQLPAVAVPGRIELGGGDSRSHQR